jgi:hypothetical protein
MHIIHSISSGIEEDNDELGGTGIPGIIFWPLPLTPLSALTIS